MNKSLIKAENDDSLRIFKQNIQGGKQMASYETFGTWFSYHKPYWETRLEDASNYVIEKTGMSRDELERLLHYLHEEGILVDIR